MNDNNKFPASRPYISTHAEPNPGVEAAAKLFGSLHRMAIHFEVAYSTARRWLYDVCPPERAVEIERATEGKVTREMIRPDLFA